MTHLSRTPRLPPPVLITRPAQLALLMAALREQPAIAVDTESNSLHAYREQVCLIQFSTPQADYLVDPLADLDLSPLGELFANPAIEKVFHAADYDIACLKRDFGWSFANLFDTQWAARILGWSQVGLASILKTHFNVHVNKKWQRFNWGERPLPTEALDYARLDTHYLLPLRDRLLAELRSRGRLEEAREVFAELTAIEPHFSSFTPDDFWRIRGAWDLDPQGQAILRRLAIWRDREARRRNRPPFKVLGDSTLVALARVRPDRTEAMIGIPGLKEHHIRRYGSALLRAIREGKKDPPPPPPPRPPRPDEIAVLRYEALREWRRQVAARRGVDPDVVISNAALWAIASHAPSSPEALAELGVLGPWKLRTYGEALIQVLHS